jgi:hypothetical protein
MASSILNSDDGVISGTSGLKSTGGDACSVYWIRTEEHTDMFKEGYIGVSMDAELRWKQHGRRMGNPHLRYAIEKYGWDNLKKEVIVIASRDYCIDIEKKLRPEPDTGWNIVPGGGYPPRGFGVTFKPGHTPWLKGKNLPEHLKKQISEKLKGHPPPNKGVKGQVPWNKGIPMSAETKAKLSASKKGVKLSDITRARMSASRMGKSPYQMTDEVRAKISQTLKLRNANKKGVGDAFLDSEQ